MHRVDALRNYDIGELDVLWDVASLCLEQCHQFVIWAYVLHSFRGMVFDPTYQHHLKSVYDVVIEILQLLCSKGYCYFLDYMAILHYLHGNREHVFPPVIKTKIEDFTEEDCTVLTGLSKSQLVRLYHQLRIPETLVYERRYRFKGEECFLP